jgi:predicted transposase YbfD/YdcC
MRQHWHIENKLHWVRDVTLGEALHQATTRNRPHVLAVLRNWASPLNVATSPLRR